MPSGLPGVLMGQKGVSALARAHLGLLMVLLAGVLALPRGDSAWAKTHPKIDNVASG